MKKNNIGIITITSGTNHGNRLQNYALQKYLETHFDCNVETVYNFSSTLIYEMKKIFMFPKKIKNSDRQNNFYSFNNKFIKFSDFSINNFFKNKKLLKYDFLICGSDQIWNSYFAENDRANFGYFYKKQKVLSYAASFGTNDICKNKIRKYKKYLNNLDYISVREDAGKRIVNQLINNKKVYVNIDPTMLLNKNEWEEIIDKPNFDIPKKYILLYFLGKINSEYKKAIDACARSNNCEIIDLCDKNGKYYNLGPDNFLYLEKNAFLICTDSFHSSVFGFIFNVPFVIFERCDKTMNNMGSRIDTLLSKFKLRNRKFDGVITKENLNNDYIEGYKILEKERKKSEEFLKKALDIKK